jgi:hypothetical protein
MISASNTGRGSVLMFINIFYLPSLSHAVGYFAYLLPIAGIR